MSYSEPLINQLRIFFLSIGVGFLICSLYIVINGAFRIFGKSKYVVYISDGIFCFFTAIVSFFFMVLYNNGRVRFHLFLGEAIGFFSLYFSLGRYILSFLIRLSDTLHYVICIFLKPYFMIFDSVKEGVKGFYFKIKNNIEKITKNKKNLKNIRKKYLKNSDKSV